MDLNELDKLMEMMKKYGVVVYKHTKPDGGTLKLVAAPSEATSNTGIWVNKDSEEDDTPETEVDKSVGFNPYSKFNLHDYE
jgi:hypothetical protein